MFEVTLFFLTFIPMMIFIAFGIPLIVGILVYRDANKRVDCSPWLWALVAALVPSFIGLIIYAIIRRDYPLKSEYQGFNGGYYQEGFDQSYNQNAEADGQASYEQRFDENGNPIPVAKPHRGFPTWAKVLLIIGAILIVVGMIAGCSALVSAVFGYHTMTPDHLDHFYYEF